ncbi:MAG: class I tRNA ligase family protein, partial [Planctomycetota bacterium]
EGEALELERALNQAFARINDSFKLLNFNTAVAALMTFLNDASKRSESLRRDQADRLIRALAPFAPHVAEEFWERLGGAGSVHHAAWPEVREQYLVADTIEVVVQVNGKLRARVEVPAEADKDSVAEAAAAEVPSWLEGKDIVKTVVVPGRLVNFVVKG